MDIIESANYVISKLSEEEEIYLQNINLDIKKILIDIGDIGDIKKATSF